MTAYMIVKIDAKERTGCHGAVQRQPNKWSTVYSRKSKIKANAETLSTRWSAERKPREFVLRRRETRICDREPTHLELHINDPVRFRAECWVAN